MKAAPRTLLGQAWLVPAASAVTFAVCFMARTIFGAIGIPIKETLNPDTTEFGLLTITPILTSAHSVTWWVMWVSWICLFLLNYPQTDFSIVTADNVKTFHLGLDVYALTGLMSILGLAGGLGGDLLPVLFGVLMDVTGIRSSAFMVMYGLVWVSLIGMYRIEVRKTERMGAEAEGFSFAG